MQNTDVSFWLTSLVSIAFIFNLYQIISFLLQQIDFKFYENVKNTQKQFKNDRNLYKSSTEAIDEGRINHKQIGTLNLKALNFSNSLLFSHSFAYLLIYLAWT